MSPSVCIWIALWLISLIFWILFLIFIILTWWGRVFLVLFSDVKVRVIRHLLLLNDQLQFSLCFFIISVEHFLFLLILDLLFTLKNQVLLVKFINAEVEVEIKVITTSGIPSLFLLLLLSRWRSHIWLIIRSVMICLGINSSEVWTSMRTVEATRWLIGSFESAFFFLNDVVEVIWPSKFHS